MEKVEKLLNLAFHKDTPENESVAAIRALRNLIGSEDYKKVIGIGTPRSGSNSKTVVTETKEIYIYKTKENQKYLKTTFSLTIPNSYIVSFVKCVIVDIMEFHLTIHMKKFEQRGNYLSSPLLWDFIIYGAEQELKNFSKKLDYYVDQIAKGNKIDRDQIIEKKPIVEKKKRKSYFQNIIDAICGIQ